MATTGLGTALRKLRERRTLSLRETGQLTGIDYAYIHRLETGQKNAPSNELLGKLLKILKPSARDTEIVEWLVTFTEADPALVDFVIDNPDIEIDVFTAAAGMRHRGTSRPDPATIISRVQRAFNDLD